jgi:hypothetical protein
MDIVEGGSILLGNGDGTFKPRVNYDSNTGSLTVADLNSDGRVDIVIANQYANTISVLLNILPATYSTTTLITFEPTTTNNTEIAQNHSSTSKSYTTVILVSVVSALALGIMATCGYVIYKRCYHHSYVAPQREVDGKKYDADLTSNEMIAMTPRHATVYDNPGYNHIYEEIDSNYEIPTVQVINHAYEYDKAQPHDQTWKPADDDL